MIHRLNLNNYELVDNAKVIGQNGVILTPIGRDVPPMYYRRRKKDPAAEGLVDTVTNAVWSKNCKVYIEGTRDEYNARVRWWFDSIDTDFMQELHDTYCVNADIDLQEELAKMKSWLLTCRVGERKENIRTFIQRNLNKKVARLWYHEGEKNANS